MLIRALLCFTYLLPKLNVDPMGKRIRPDFLSQHFPDFLVAHQMKRIRFHDLRHSCASLLYANGVRYCINSAALRFVPYEKMETEGYGYLLYLFEK